LLPAIICCKIISSKSLGVNLTPLSIELYKKYGSGFTDEDEEILRAIKLDKSTVEEISIFTNLKENFVENRLEFMEQKEVVWDLHGSWEIDDDSIRKRIPK